MRTVRTKIYKFQELEEKAKKKALESLSNINVDYDWWDFVYDDFAAFCDIIGIDVDLKKTNFTLSYSQGDGCAFTASIDLPKLLQAIKSEAWKENYPKENIQFKKVTQNIERVARLIEAGKIDGSAWIRQANRETTSVFENEYGFTQSGLIANPKNINNALTDLIDLLDNVTKTLNKWLFNNLRSTCYHLMSEAAIVETIESNEYEFYQNGKMYAN